MLYTVEEVASKLNVSKTAIYNKLKLKEYKNSVIKKQGKSMIDEELFKLIQDSLKIRNQLENEVNKKSETTEDSAVNGSLINFNQDLISTLIKQLEEKDKQIAERDTLIKTMTENHRTQIAELNELHRNTQFLFKQLQEMQQQDIKLIQAEDISPHSAENEPVQPEKKKRFGFWRK